MKVPKNIKTYKHFAKTVKTSNWLNDLFKIVGNDTDTGVAFVIKYLNKNVSDSFLDALQDLQLILRKKKMDAVSALAMWVDANVSVKQQRIII